jgi:hypothetical protein
MGGAHSTHEINYKGVQNFASEMSWEDTACDT